MDALFGIIEFWKIFMQFIIYFLTWNQITIHIWTINYKMDSVVCKGNSLGMRIAPATDVVNAKWRRLVCECNQNQIFLAGDKLLYHTLPIAIAGGLYFICIFWARFKSMTWWQATKHIAARLVWTSIRTVWMVELSSDYRCWIISFYIRPTRVKDTWENLLHIFPATCAWIGKKWFCVRSSTLIAYGSWPHNNSCM